MINFKKRFSAIALAACMVAGLFAGSPIGEGLESQVNAGTV